MTPVYLTTDPRMQFPLYDIHPSNPSRTFLYMKVLALALNSALCYGSYIDPRIPAGLHLSEHEAMIYLSAETKSMPTFSPEDQKRYMQCSASLVILGIKLPRHLGECMCENDIRRVYAPSVYIVQEAREYAIGYLSGDLIEDGGSLLAKPEIKEKLKSMVPTLERVAESCNSGRCCPKIV